MRSLVASSGSSPRTSAMNRSASSRRKLLELDAEREVGRKGVVDDGVDQQEFTMTFLSSTRKMAVRAVSGRNFLPNFLPNSGDLRTPGVTAHRSPEPR